MNGKIMIVIIVLFLPQNIFALNLYGSFEARGVFLQNHKIEIADSNTDIQIAPTLNFNGDYAYKIGLGVSFLKIFDVGIFFDKMLDEDQKHDGPFEKTYPFAGNYSKEGYSYENPTSLLNNGTGKAKGKFGLSIIDIEGGINFRIDPGIYFRLMIGVRFAKYKQDMWVNRDNECNENCDFTKGEPLGSERYLDQKIDGFGSRFGLSVVAPIKKTNLNLIGSFSYSILHAKKDLNDGFFRIAHTETDGIIIRQTGESIENSIAIVDQDITIENFDMEAGIQYDIKFSKKRIISLICGYKYSAHYGALNTYGVSLQNIKDPVSSQKIELNSFGNKEDDFFSEGPFLRIGFKF